MIAELGALGTQVTCDNCGNQKCFNTNLGDSYGLDHFEELNRQMNAQGWMTVDVNDRERQLCPDCLEGMEEGDDGTSQDE